MATSNYGLVKGLAVDISPMMKYEEAKNMRTAMAEQKAREKQASDIERMGSMFKVDTSKTGIPYYQKAQQDLVSAWYADAANKYSKNPNYINSLEFNQSTDMMHAKLASLGASDKALAEDLHYTTTNPDKANAKEGFADAVKSYDGLKNYFAKNNNGSDSYTPAMGLDKVINEPDLIYKSLVNVPSNPQTEIGYVGGHPVRQTVYHLDPEGRTHAALDVWQTTPEIQKKYNNDFNAWLNIYPKEAKKYNIAGLPEPNNYTYNSRGGGIANDKFSLTSTVKGSYSIQTDGVAENPTWTLSGIPLQDEKGQPISVTKPSGKYLAIQVDDNNKAKLAVIQLDAQPDRKLTLEQIKALKPGDEGYAKKDALIDEANNTRGYTAILKTPERVVYAPINQDIVNDFYARTKTSKKDGLLLPGWSYVNPNSGSKKAATAPKATGKVTVIKSDGSDAATWDKKNQYNVGGTILYFNTTTNKWDKK